MIRSKNLPPIAPGRPITGILVAGGTGTRLWPLTAGVSKQLLPVYDKPVIYYPLSSLMLAGIRHVVVVSTPKDLPILRQLLGSGSAIGMEFDYIEQPQPGGIGQAILLARDACPIGRVGVALGDNLFHGSHFSDVVADAAASNRPRIFTQRVSSPQDYAVVSLGPDASIVDIVEKPTTPPSDRAVPGLYFYNTDIFDMLKEQAPSPRGELEITDLNRTLLHQENLDIMPLPRGTAWLDLGTAHSLHEASTYVRVLQGRQGQLIGSIEEIAWRRGWISALQLLGYLDGVPASSYALTLRTLVDGSSAPGVDSGDLYQAPQPS